MAIQRGRNGGVTGVVDITGTPKFNVHVSFFEESLGVQSLPVEGRGDDTPWVPTMAVRPGGQLVMSGGAQFRQPPLPSAFKGQEGTIVLQFHEAAKQTVSVRIDTAKIKLDASNEDTWKITLVATILADPTQAGWNTDAPVATDPDPLNKETFAGLSKVHDPLGLLDSGTRSFFIAPVTNDDAAERQELVDAITEAVAPFPGAKVKFARLEPGRTFNTLVLSLQFSRTDSEEDVINPATSTTTDDNKLASSAQAAGVFAGPVDPGGDFVERTTTTQELHDGATRTVKTYGLLDTKQDIEFPGTVTGNDPYDLQDNGTVTTVHNSATLPADPTAPLGQLVERNTVQLNRYRWRTTWSYANTNSSQSLTFPASPIEDDPSNLNDEEQISQITTSSTLPSDPSPTLSGLKVRRRRSVRVSGTPEQWQHTFFFARTNTEDDVEFGGTEYQLDQSGVPISSTASVTVVESDGTPDGGVTVDGLVLRYIRKKQLHDSKWAITYIFGERTPEQDIEYPGMIEINDPDNLTDTWDITVVTDDDIYPSSLNTPPSGLKLRGVRTERLTNSGNYKHVAEYGRRDHEDDIEMPATVYVADQSGNVVAGSARVAVVEDDATSDGGVSVSGLVLRDIQREPIHDSKWKHTYIFGQTTHEEDIEFPGTESNDDPSDLASTATVTLVNSSSSAPASIASSPPTVGGVTLKLRRTKSVQLTNAGRWAHTGYYALTTEEDDIEMGGSSVTDDDSDIADSQITVVVTASGTPSNPGTPSGLKLRETVTRQLNDAKWRHEFRYARTNREDDVEFGDTATILDAEALESGGTIAVINTSSTPPATPSAPATDTKLISTTTKQLHGAATPKYVHIFRYGVRTSQEDIEWLQAKAVVEAGQLERNPVTVEVTSSSTAGSGTNPDSTNLSLYRTVSHRVTDTQYVHVFEWRPLTATEEVTAKGSETTIDSNVAVSPPASLERDDRVVTVTASATPAAADADAAGRICYRIETTKIGKVKWRHTYHYGFRSNETKLEADRTQTTTDAQNLEHSAVTADVWLVSGGAPVDPSAPAAPTGLKLVDKTDLEIQNPLYRIRVYKWATRDKKDDIELPNSSWIWTPFENSKRRVTTVAASTDALATLGEAFVAANKTDTTIDRYEVRRLNAAYVQTVVDYISQFSNVKARVYGGWQYFDSRFVTGNVQVYVSQVIARGDGLYEVLIVPQKQWFSHIDFTLSRRVSQSVLPTFFEKVGTRNNNSFLGIPAGLCGYLGGEPEMERSFAFPHVMAANYDFRFSTRGLYESEGLCMGWFITDASVSVGWVNASTFGWGGAGLPGADYDEFLA